MRTSWPLVPIREFATYVARGENPKAGTTYRQIGVRWWGEGAYEREPIDGANTKYSTFFRAEVGDLIFNKIWARHGAIAIVGPELAGTYGAAEFRTLTLDAAMVHQRWLHWLSKWPAFWAACQDESRGSSGKNRIKPERFLDIQVPLPPVEVQIEVVSRIDAVAQRVAEARSLQDKIIERHREMLHAAYEEAVREESVAVLFGELVEQSRESTSIADDQECTRLTVSLNFKGVRLRDRVHGSSIRTRNQYVARRGQLIYSRIDARNGAFGFVPDELDGAVVTGDFPCFNVQRDRVSPEVLWIMITRPEFIEACVSASRGVTNRRRMKEAQLCGIPVRLPGHAGQELLRKLMRHVRASGALHAQIQSELESVMPSALHEAFGGELVEANT